MCPPTWKAAMGMVCLRIERVGERSLDVQFSWRREPSQQRPATNANWTIVRVTGNLKLLRITLPVLLETAELAYQRMQRRTKRTVCTEGRLMPADAADDADDVEAALDTPLNTADTDCCIRPSVSETVLPVLGERA